MMPVKKNLDNRMSKASCSFGRLSKRVWQSFAPPSHEDPGIVSRRRSHPPVLCRDLGSQPEADQATRAVLPKLLVLHLWHQRLCVKPSSSPESQPAQHRVHPTSGAAALGWPRHKDGGHMHAKSSFLRRASRRKAGSWCSRKALQRPAEGTAYTDGNQPSVMAVGGLKPRQLVLISEKSQS